MALIILLVHMSEFQKLTLRALAVLFFLCNIAQIMMMSHKCFLSPARMMELPYASEKLGLEVGGW